MHTSTRVLIDTSWESVTVMLTSFLLASWATDTAVSKSLPSATFSETIAAAFFYVLARARVPRQMWPQCMWCVVCVCVREREFRLFFYVLARACVHRQINVTCDPSACGALCMCVCERVLDYRWSANWMFWQPFQKLWIRHCHHLPLHFVSRSICLECCDAVYTVSRACVYLHHMRVCLYILTGIVLLQFVQAL